MRFIFVSLFIYCPFFCKLGTLFLLSLINLKNSFTKICFNYTLRNKKCSELPYVPYSISPLIAELSDCSRMLDRKVPKI